MLPCLHASLYRNCFLVKSLTFNQCKLYGSVQTKYLLKLGFVDIPSQNVFFMKKMNPKFLLKFHLFEIQMNSK